MSVEERQEFGHWEMDIVLGTPDQHCVVLVERVSGATLVGKLRYRRAAASTNV